MDKEFAEAFKEDLELNEMKWEVGVVYHQEFKNGDKVYFRADSVQKNKRWKGLSVDEFGGRQKKAKSASADEKQQGWETTPKNEIPKGLKEEVEIDEGKFKKGDIVIPNMGPHKGDKHKIIHDFGDGSYNITPQKHSRFIKYKQGAAKAKENQLKLVKEEVEEASTYRDRTKDDEKKKKKHFAFGGKKKSRHGESGYGKGEEVEVDEEIFYWYIIKGDLANGKIVYAGNEKQVKLKRHDPKFSGDFVMTKSRKMKKVGEKWKKSMGVSEEVELDEMFFKITIPDLPPVFVEGDSGSKIRRSMKLKLRPDVYKDLDVERVSRADMAKKYRSLAKAEKEKEEEDEVKEGLDEVAPPGWEGTVKKMKGDKNIDNPWALAWWMKSKGYKSNANEEVWYREQNALEEDFVTNRMGGGNIEYRSPLLFSKKKQKLVKRKYPAGTMMAYEEVELTEALKPADKKVIDAFYKENSLVGKLLSSTGKSLEKHGVGGQTIAAWLKGKIAITAVSDVKSTESILNYMKKSIPKNNFDPKSYKKFFEEVEVAEAKMSDPMIAKLKDKYESLRGKRLSLGQNAEIAKIVSGMGKDKEVLLQLVKADIPFISLNAATFLMDKHGMKAKDINLGNKIVRKQEIKSKIIDDSYHGTFAGNDVFIVNSDTFHTCRLGKQKYHRYEKYVGNGKIGQAIREFGLTNPKKPIILQNGEGGPMLYLRYGGSKRYA